jgi:hypothetical protein
MFNNYDLRDLNPIMPCSENNIGAHGSLFFLGKNSAS